MTVSGSINCVNHPAVHALALCVDCHKQICSECATSWEGINLCAPCLRTRSADRSISNRGVSGWLTSLLTIGILLWFLPRLWVTIAVVFASALPR